jgi:hypothetical protein
LEVLVDGIWSRLERNIFGFRVSITALLFMSLVAFFPEFASASNLKVSTTALPSAQVGSVYSAALSATGGTAPYKWSVPSGSWPAGVGLSYFGVFCCTPSSAGQYTFLVQVKDSAARPATATASLTINVAPATAATTATPLTITTASLPNATSGAIYATSLVAAGGTPPYTWSVASGSLPGGLALASSGALSGSPALAGQYSFLVQVKDSAASPQAATTSLGINVVSSSTSASTAPPASTGSPAKYYSPTSFINTPIPSNAVIDPNSAAMVATSLTAYESQAFLTNGGDGMAVAFAGSGDPVYTVTCTMYSTSACTVGGAGAQFKIPLGATPTTGSDHHLVVAYTAMDGSQYAGMELDMWEASYDSATNTWSADQVAINNLSASGWGAGCALGFLCNNSNVSAGFDGLAGAIRPEEIQAGVISHALVISSPAIRASYVACPGTHTDGGASSSAIPQGALIQLDPTFNVASQSWPEWVKIIATAMQTYGAYVRDTSGALDIYGVTNDNPGTILWSSVDVPVDQFENLSILPWSSMRVIKMTQNEGNGVCH